MKKNDLIPIFQSFSKKEVKDFKKWLLSPAHNSREDVVLLYEYLILDENLYGSATLEKESEFGSIFTNETYNDAKMRQVIYFLKFAPIAACLWWVLVLALEQHRLGWHRALPLHFVGRVASVVFLQDISQLIRQYKQRKLYRKNFRIAMILF